MTMAKPRPNIPADEQAVVKLRYDKNRPSIELRTYKSGISLHTPGEALWLTANDAERVGRALIRMARLRRQIDAAEKRYMAWTKNR
jgi:hypothetical protein